MTTVPPAQSSLLPGFTDPVHQSQQAFRATLNALARPGTPRILPAPAAAPSGWGPALTAMALTVFDQDTPVWLDAIAASAEAIAHLRFHCGCPVVSVPDIALFAVIADPAHAPPLHTFPIGDPQSPERSGTIILAIESLTDGAPLRWTGPGIKGSVTVAPTGLPSNFVLQWADNHALYPSGIDVFLVAGDQIIGLPRTTAIEEV